VVSCWFPTVAAWVPVRVACEVCGAQSGTGVSQSTSVSLATHHSTSFSIIIITQGWHNRPTGGRSAEWAQLDSTPYYTNLKKVEGGSNSKDNNSVLEVLGQIPYAFSVAIQISGVSYLHLVLWLMCRLHVIASFMPLWHGAIIWVINVYQELATVLNIMSHLFII
jgi:hypothetical protein